MNDHQNLAARVEALEKAVQSLLGAVSLMESLLEKDRGGAGEGAKKAGKAGAKKRAPKKKRVSQA